MVDWGLLTELDTLERQVSYKRKKYEGRLILGKFLTLPANLNHSYGAVSHMRELGGSLTFGDTGMIMTSQSQWSKT